MNRYPIGKPPKWWSPRPSRFWMRVWRRRRRRILHRDENVQSVSIAGLENVRAAMDAGHGVLIVANHPTHADWLTIYEALDQLRVPCYVMTTWQVFELAGPIVRMQYRQHGCFSIDRDGMDRQAFRCSVEILAKSSDPLVIFPEGEVYHTADRVAPFREGPAAIALAAVKRAQRPVAVIPCTLQYKYTESPLAELLEVMGRVEQKLKLPAGGALDLVERIYRAGDAATAKLEREYLGESHEAKPLRERMPRLLDVMLNELDERYGVHTGRWTAAERVTRLRQKAIARRSELQNENGQATDQHVAALNEVERDIEKMFQALQISSYPSGYLQANPTLERIAETIDKLEEDVLGAETAGIRGVRAATIRFDEPMLITQPGERGAAETLTREMHARLQGMIDTGSRQRSSHIP